MTQRLYSTIPLFEGKQSLEIILENGMITEAGFVPWQASHEQNEDHPVLEQLQAYYRDPKQAFQLKLQGKGTAYQQRVWQVLQTIPAGEVRTYGDIARQLNSSPRAVGMACRSNPIALIVPCHRVVAKGHLGGYSGYTEGEIFLRKQRLLQHEGVI